MAPAAACAYVNPDGHKCGLAEPHRHIYEWRDTGVAWWIELLPEPLFAEES